MQETIKRGATAKPTQVDRNPDGSPTYKRVEDWIEALVDWKLQELLALQARCKFDN